MNILPLILTFLIIFACISFTFLKEAKSFFLAETTLASFHKTERELNNKITARVYRKAGGEPINKKQPAAAKSKKETTYFSRRSFFPPLEESKFNIGPLVKYEGDIKQHPLFEPLAKMLRLLYKPFFDSEKIEYRFVQTMIAKARKFPEPTDLAELFPDDLKLRTIYYKMLKGTNQYNQKGSIPPLKDFVAWKKDGPALFFSFASPIALKSLFDKKMADTIVQEEKKKWEQSGKYYYFSKEDLQQLLVNNPALTSQFTNLDPYLDYSKQINRREEIGGIDPKTGLSVKKFL